MNPIVLLILALISIFSLFIYLSSLYQIYEPKDALYEHPLTCEDSPISYCIVSKSYYFKELASTLDYATVAKEYNEWLVANNQLNKTVFQMRYHQDRKAFQAHALEDLTHGQHLISLAEGSIFYKLSMSARNFNSQMNATKLENDQYVLHKLNYTQIPNIIILSLVYHIYHHELSNYRPWILSLSPNINNFFSRMTAYEYNTLLKNNKEVSPFIKDYFDSFEREWKTLEYFIRKKMSAEERESFFNGHTFTKADYLFARSVVENHAWSINNDKDMIVFPSHDNFYRKNKESEDNFNDFIRQQEVVPIDNKTVHFRFIADRPTPKDSVIYQSFQEPRAFFSAFLYGETPRHSPVECVNTELFVYEDVFSAGDKKKAFLKWAAESGALCLGVNSYSMARVSIIGAIMNMNSKEIDECFAIMNAVNDNEDRYKVFLEKCASPEWTKFDPRKTAFKSLNKTLEFLEGYLKQTSEYLTLRKDNGKDHRNAQVLFDYAEEKTDLTKKLIEKLRSLTAERPLIINERLVEAENAPELKNAEKKTEI